MNDFLVFMLIIVLIGVWMYHRGSRCKHQWVTVKDEVYPNSIIGVLSKYHNFSVGKTASMMATHILVQKCTKCGDLDKLVTKV